LLSFIEDLSLLVLVESRSHTNPRCRIPATQVIKDRARPNWQATKTDIVRQSGAIRLVRRLRSLLP
jgi:hypothetical protein